MQTALGSTALTRRLLQTWQDLSLAFRPLSPLLFLPAWGLEQACRDVGCNVSLSGVFTVDSGIHRIHLPKPEESPDDAFSPVEHALGVILTGGVAMHDVWLLTVGIGLLLSFLGGGGLALLLSGRKRRKKADKWEARIAYLEKAVNRAGVLNNQFFHSLEITQKRLESLLTQADWAEQNLRRLLTQTAAAGDKGGGRTDAYTTAALLLSEGDGVQQVARVLKLPLAQVRLLQELQEHLQKEKGAGSQEKVASPGTGAPEVTLSHGPARPLNGSFRSGTHLAANGREL
ncbi:MAG: hypothetical protein HYZ72_01130 [Deltaproteobacteria bacterium]|nr:hypothetical protein [Deltaproteobacteria bacterium]